MDSSMTWMNWWAGADGVVRAILLTLIVLSVVGWSVILYKFYCFNGLLRQEQRMRTALTQRKGWDALTTLLGESLHLLAEPRGAHWEAQVAHAIREKRVYLENGLSFLASIGVSTPFIGLLGTVWGIMHALAGLNHQTALSLDLVAGPVAEALVATAAGLFAAIPAAVGYNLLIRRLRCLMTLAEGNLLHLLAVTQGERHGR
ncbi:MAG: MotA/TolQ/ExbB proton channel family protein [Magnetococcales bacterium]|nr:MotA/TolQ/ExbB proton channel family protein [Magnetococcales bacterium]